MKKAMLVVNPCAGRRIPNLDVAYIVLTMQKNGYKIKVFYTRKPGDATTFVKNNGANFDTIICCGGDGTFHEVINGMLLLGVNRPIGYIPTGTTNDFAKSIGISSEIKKAVQTIIKNESESYDIGRFNNEYFNYVASFGAFSDIPYLTSQRSKNILGHFAYVLEALKNLKSLAPVKVRMSMDNNFVNDEFVFGAVANSLSIGGVLKFKESMVNFNDGKFEVILIKKPANAYEVYKVIRNLRNGVYNSDNIIFGIAREIKAEFVNKADWNLDGEYVDAGKVVNIKSLQRRIKIIR